jgi:hypothetical protein
MLIKFQNLGALLQGEFELGEFTIICGKNNTGKTYATYALFGFFSFWRETFPIKIPEKYVEELLTDGTTALSIQEFVEDADNIIQQGCKAYTKFLPTVFASSSKNFSDTIFEVFIDKKDIQPVPEFFRQIGSAKGHLFSIEKKKDQNTIIARLFTRLINIGIRVFITTHSDYIIKELNTLIMLNQDKPHIKEIAEKEKYHPNEFISPDFVKVYIAEMALIKLEGKTKRSRCQTLTKGDVDPELGIEAKSFDTTIDEMNRIQEEIIWGESDDE